MPVTRRYLPEKDPQEICNFGIDFSFLLPPGVGVKSGTLQILTNTATPADASASFTIGPVQVTGRRIWANVAGGVSGVDYQFKWTAVDTLGNVWPRTCLCLVAPTS